MMSKVCGIYVIRCIPTGREYIGSSVDINCRIATHIKFLRRNKHVNCKLQRAWNKYEAHDFEHSVLEECDRNNLLLRETFWIHKRKSFGKGFNLTAVADPLAHICATVEWRKRSSERCKRLHEEGKLTRPIRTEEHHQRSSIRMKRLHAEGILGKPRTIEEHQRTYYEGVANGVVRNTPKQRKDASERMRYMNWLRNNANRS